MKKKIFSIILIILGFIIVVLVLWIRFAPTKNLGFLKTNPQNPVTKVLCLYPVKIQGNSMEPLFKNGQRVNFSKCFDEKNLNVSEMIIYKADNVQRIAVIREVLKNGGVEYKISPQARINEITDIKSETIVAVYSP